MSRCSGCGQPIGSEETPVYADGDEVYHMGCEFAEIHTEAGSGGFGR